MSSILDKFAARRYGELLPQTTAQFFALQLARKVEDVEAVRAYAEILDNRSEEAVLVAYRRAVAASGTTSASLARNFHTALNRVNGHGPSTDQTRLLSIRVERRSVSAAILRGRHIEDAETRHLSSSRARAEASAVSFMRWLLSNFEIESATIETSSENPAVQRAALHGLILNVLRDYRLPLFQIPKAGLISAFAHPEPRSRREVREVIQGIWPILGNNPGLLDAVALGLYVQTERLFTLLD